MHVMTHNRRVCVPPIFPACFGVLRLVCKNVLQQQCMAQDVLG